MTETMLEINRLKQIFANIKYPQTIVNQTVRICMDKYICPPMYPFIFNFVVSQLPNQIAKPLNK